MITNLLLKRVTVDEMLVHKDQDYNPQTWRESINRMTKYDKCQFYLIEPDGVYSYTRFYASYIADGIYFFSDWSAYSSSLSSNGFCKISVAENGQVFKYMFHGPDGVEGYAENCPVNRKYFRDHLTPMGVMVSNNI